MKLKNIMEKITGKKHNARIVRDMKLRCKGDAKEEYSFSITSDCRMWMTELHGFFKEASGIMPISDYETLIGANRALLDLTIADISAGIENPKFNVYIEVFE